MADILRAFLREHLPDDRANGIVRILDPFMRMTESDQFTFSTEVNAIDFALSTCVDTLTEIPCIKILCLKVDTGLLPAKILDGLNAKILGHELKDDPTKQLTPQTREDLTYALRHRFLKDLCGTMNNLMDIGHLRRPSDDLWFIIYSWIASELVNDPLHALSRHALKQIVLQASKGWIVLGIHTDPDAKILVLGGGRDCYIPLPFAL